MQLVCELLLCRVVLASFGTRQKLDPAMVSLGPLIEKSFSTREGGQEPDSFFEVSRKVGIASSPFRDVATLIQDVLTFNLLSSLARQFGGVDLQLATDRSQQLFVLSGFANNVFQPAECSDTLLRLHGQDAPEAKDSSMRHIFMLSLPVLRVSSPFHH